MPFHVIPAIDLLDAKVVRLHQGDYKQATVYSENLLEYVADFQQAGFDHIHIVDLNGAKEGRFVNLHLIEEVIQKTGVKVQTGGGVRAYEHIQKLLEHGIHQVICTSFAVKNEEAWFKAISDFGPDHCILGMDLKNGKIAHSGWLETADEEVQHVLSRHHKAGIKRVLCTDISKDGTLQGPNLSLYETLKKQFTDIEFIASGGVSNAKDILELAKLELYGTVVGRAFYEGKVTTQEMAQLHNP